MHVKIIGMIFLLGIILTVGCTSAPLQAQPSASAPSQGQPSVPLPDPLALPGMSAEELEELQRQVEETRKQLEQQAQEAQQIISTSETAFPETSLTVSESEKPQLESVLERVQGQSSGILPYAAVDTDKITSLFIDYKGGVLSTELTGGVKVFLIVPKDSVIEEAEISLIPYTGMPSGARHPKLSKEYGYGVQVIMDSLQSSIPAYLVFDLSNGRARERIANSGQWFNRCDPGMPWFNPVICARRNKVGAEKILEKEKAIATPIHNEEFNNLIFSRLTIPIGIDEFIVTEIIKGDVYIPLKLDQALAYDLANGTFGNYTNHNEQLEALALANAWDLPLTQKQLDYGIGSFDADSYASLKKAIILSPKLAELMQSKAGQAVDEDEKEEWEYLASEYAEVTSEARELIYENARADAGDGDDFAVEAAAAIGTLSDADVEGADETANAMQAVIQERLDNAWEALQGSVGNLAAMGEFRARQNGNLSDLEGGDSLTGGNAEGTFDGFNDAANAIVADELNDAKATIRDILEAVGIAQLLGLDNADELMDDAINDIEEILKGICGKTGHSARTYLEAGAIAQLVGLNELGSQCLDKAKDAVNEECDALVKKTLKNYGINECSEAVGLS